MREGRFTWYAWRATTRGRRARFHEFVAVDALGHDGADEQTLGRAVVNAQTQPTATRELERVAGDLISHDHMLNHPLG